jgi:hypothetical protein
MPPATGMRPPAAAGLQERGHSEHNAETAKKHGNPLSNGKEETPWETQVKRKFASCMPQRLPLTLLNSSASEKSTCATTCHRRGFPPLVQNRSMPCKKCNPATSHVAGAPWERFVPNADRFGHSVQTLTAVPTATATAKAPAHHHANAQTKACARRCGTVAVRSDPAPG